jgi:hypothetical protein
MAKHRFGTEAGGFLSGALLYRVGECFVDAPSVVTQEVFPAIVNTDESRQVLIEGMLVNDALDSTDPCAFFYMSQVGGRADPRHKFQQSHRSNYLST